MIPYFWVYDTHRLTCGCISGEISDLGVDIHYFLGYKTSNISETITPRVPKPIPLWSVGIFTITPVFHGRNSYQEFLALYGCRDFRPGKAVKMKNPSSEKSQLWKVGFFESWGFPDGNSIIELSPLCLLQESGLLNMVILYSSSQYVCRICL